MTAPDLQVEPCAALSSGRASDLDGRLRSAQGLPDFREGGGDGRTTNQPSPVGPV